MKLSAGVEWSIHCCVVLSQANRPTPAARLAELHGVSATSLAKHLQSLAKAGIVYPVEGRDGGYALTRAASAVTVLDVVQAIDGVQPAFRCTEIRQRGELACAPDDCRAPCGVAAVMARAEAAWRGSLQSVTLQDLADTIDVDALRAILARTGE
ncbi:Rrf2 family transcriptional regulator [Gordonia sp. PDNC005]|uniref:RrF2 family transcriptional regulator n=1 Tax=unclassified Gordonia (in: high G+C Gram-positive bacteria) TaxID=2657482 RepID=UPI001964A584|nr:Rrf2 family transcriptional regulator [Gordonia sp. PDNC005]QRY62949.1 Rrf2 family transcriptional regulator [Gordonia sp. PDNC005]